MSKADLIIELTKKKTRRVSLQFNAKLWELFLKSANKEQRVPTQLLEELILKHLEKQNLLK
ncbi:MAG: hypothetical protein ACM3SR_13875 [Ignavibacteriales bacterium]